MKRLSGALMLLLTALAVSFGQTYTWDGGGDGTSWTSADNWDPIRAIPGLNDVILFNTGTILAITSVPVAETIGRLVVTSNTTVSLQGSSSALAVSGGTGVDLDVDAGSALNVAGLNSITLGTGTTASIGGTLTLGTCQINGLGNFTLESDGTLGIGYLGSTAGEGGLTFNIQVTGTKDYGLAGNFIYNGSGGSQVTGSDLPSSMKSLTIDNSNGVTVSHGLNKNISGTLTMANGNLTSSTTNLILGISASISGEAPGRYYRGPLMAERTVATGSSTFGGIGVEINAGTDDVGNVSVLRTAGDSGIVTVNSNTGISRKWTVSGLANPPTNGRTLTFSWIADDDNSKDLTTAQVWRSTNSGTSWNAIGGPQDASSTRSVSATVTSFSDFTVSDGANFLPVQVTSLTAEANHSSAVLRWTTASETDNYGFEVERRLVQSSMFNVQSLKPLNLEPETWNLVGFVPGSGTSSSPREYSFVDRGASPGRYAYRIKQIDQSGSFSYTAAIEVEVGLAPKEFTLSQNYPNPFNPATTIEFTVPEDGRVTLRLYDATGRELSTLLNEERTSGYFHSITLDGSGLGSGTYFCRLEFNGKQLTRKIILLK